VATHSNKMDVTPHLITRLVTTMRVRASPHVPSAFVLDTTMERPGAIVLGLEAEAAEAVEAVGEVLRAPVQLILEGADYFLVIPVTELVLRKSC
jgi:hypothetical protein